MLCYPFDISVKRLKILWGTNVLSRIDKTYRGMVISEQPYTAFSKDSIKSDIDKYTQNKHVMVFSGFSGLGYSDVSALKEKLTSILMEAVDKHGSNKLCVAAGATSVGIGMVYEVAKKFEIDTLGIVSEQAKGSGEISKNCGHLFYINDPDSSWKVIDAEGKSYMTYLATSKEEITRTGTFLALGGGDITLSELNEAKSLGIEVKVYPEFEPSPEKAALRKEKDSNTDLTPVRTYFTEGGYFDITRPQSQRYP